MRRSLRPTRPTCPPPTLPISLCRRGQHDMQYYTVSGWEGSGGFGLASGGRHLHYREPSGYPPIARGGYWTDFEPRPPRVAAIFGQSVSMIASTAAAVVAPVQGFLYTFLYCSPTFMNTPSMNAVYVP
jgi:hypothetical protein